MPTEDQRLVGTIVMDVLAAVPVMARDESPEETTPEYEASTAADANNPLADIQAFNLHNYYIRMSPRGRR